jgi:redox-sensitive bicupin YhaK (pirin superfamily)
MKKVLHTANTRGHANHGWLEARHSFSFAQYYNPSRMNFGVLRVLNDDWIDGGQGFGRHPHDNMEIVTIPLYGDLEHKDSMGNSGVIKQYDVQLMSAGTGVYHSEFNPNPDKKINLFQIWIFPKKLNIAPRYEQKTFLPSERQNKWQLLVAPESDTALTINQDAWFSMGKFDSGKEVTYEIRKKGNGVYIMVVEGKVRIDGDLLQKRDALGIWDADKINIEVDSDCELLVLDVPMQANNF